MRHSASSSARLIIIIRWKSWFIMWQPRRTPDGDWKDNFFAWPSLMVFIKVNVKVSLASNKRDESHSSSPIPQMLSFTFRSVHESAAGFLLGRKYANTQGAAAQSFFIGALFSFLWFGKTKFPKAEVRVIARLSSPCLHSGRCKAARLEKKKKKDAFGRKSVRTLSRMPPSRVLILYQTKARLFRE